MDSSASGTGSSSAFHGDDLSEPSNVRTTLRRLFGRVTRPPNHNTRRARFDPRGKIFSKVVCLIPETNQMHPPTAQQKIDLYYAGLSEQTITFAFSDDYHQVDEKLKRIFPALQKCGGYIIMSRGKGEMIKLSCGPCDGMLLKKASGSGKVYIRPLQENLDLTKKDVENKDEGPFEKCLKCSTNVPMNTLEEHLKSHQVDNDSDDNELLIPVQLRRYSVSSSSSISQPIADEESNTSEPAADEESTITQPDKDEESAIESNMVDVVQQSSATVVSEHAISADPNNDSNSVIEGIMEKIKSKLANGEQQPCTILRAFRDEFLQGRQLDADCQTGCDDGQTSNIFISRSTVISTAIEEIVTLENLRFPICVQFYGESAIDTGGPRRDFFRLACQEMIDKGILASKDAHLAVGNNPAYVQQGYYACGVIVGLSLLEGGDAVPLHASVLCEESEDMPSPTIFEIEFKKGLCKCGIIQLVRHFPLTKYIWTNLENTVLTVSKFLRVFEVQFSLEGSSERLKEQNAYHAFVSYVREVAGPRRRNCPSLTLPSLLGHITGNSHIPVLGFSPAATIAFVNDDSLLPRASTCINQLVHAKLSSPSTEEMNRFKEKLDWAFSSTEFGAENF